jgi:hypothetical protein
MRCYRVNFGKIMETLPEFQPQWNVEKGVVELRDAYQRYGLALKELEGARFMRIHTVRDLIEAGRLDTWLRWNEEAAVEADSQPRMATGT